MSGAPIKTVGFIGFGDQGLPMATAIAEAGFELHVWARRPASLEGLQNSSYTAHDTVADLASVCDLLAFCISEDSDIRAMVDDGLLSQLPHGAVLVNHGTGTPAFAKELAERAAAAGVSSLDAPVSGGRAAAESRKLTTLAGGDATVLDRAEPVLQSFSAHVVRTGEAGSGQLAKLFNNAMLIVNQATIADLFELAAAAGGEPRRLHQSLQLGSASSAALSLFGSMVTRETAAHLSEVEDLDVDLFAQAMRDAGVDADALVARAHSGAQRMSRVVEFLDDVS